MASRIGLSVLGLGVGIVIMVGCTGGGNQGSGSSASSGAAGGPRGGGRVSAVAVAPVTKGTLQPVLSYSGSIQAKSQVNMVPRTTGRIEQLPVDVGDIVKAGDVVAQIERASAQIQVRQAEAAVRNAQARLDQLTPTESDLAAALASVAAAQSTLTKAENDLAKLKAGPDPDAVKQAQLDLDQKKASRWQAQTNRDGTCTGRTPEYQCQAAEASVMAAEVAVNLSKVRLDAVLAGPKPEDIANATKAADSARQALASAQARLDQVKAGPKQADLAAAQASIEQAQASLESARIALADTTLVAPFDGVIASRNLSLGGTATGQTPIVSIVSSDLEVSISIEESKIGMLRRDLPVTVTVQAYLDQAFRGRVTTISPIADSKTHTFVIKITPDNSSGKLVAGMFTDVQIAALAHEGVLLIPKNAVAQRGDNQIVFVAKDGQASLRPVKVGLSDGKNVEITSGIAADDQVIVSGQSGLNDGDRITVPGQGGQPGAQPGGQRGGQPGGQSGGQPGGSNPQQGRPTPPPGGQQGGQPGAPQGGQGARPGATATTPTAGRN